MEYQDKLVDEMADNFEDQLSDALSPLFEIVKLKLLSTEDQNMPEALQLITQPDEDNPFELFTGGEDIIEFYERDPFYAKLVTEHFEDSPLDDYDLTQLHNATVRISDTLYALNDIFNSFAEYFENL